MKRMKRQLWDFFIKFDELNMAVCEKELSRHTFRGGVSKIHKIFDVMLYGIAKGENEE